MCILENYMYGVHGNIYTNNQINYKERKIRVDVGIPENGTDKNTGILVLIPGYGGNIDSHVWQRMRKEFCDTYNMITIQCDYFGNKYMNSEVPEALRKMLENKNILEGELRAKDEIHEDENEFNDMGLMQALDVVSTLLCQIYNFAHRNIMFNTKKIIIFGTSHGAYLGYLANAICPGLFSFLIDVSLYLTPYYIENIRTLYFQNSIWKLEVIKEQFLNIHPEYLYSKKLYDLRFLYERLENTCKIIAFQGTEDTMVNAEEKAAFVRSLKNAELMLIQKDEVDGKLCKNAGHGLGMDFFELFKLLMPMIQKIAREQSRAIQLNEYVVLGDENTRIKIGYAGGLPEVLEISKG